MKEPLWLSVMRMVEGVAEVPGPLSNPLILKWARDIGAPKWFNNDDQAWCAVGMNRTLLACQLPMARHADASRRDGFDLLRAQTFETYGASLTAPTLGCLLTFNRPGGYHVALYLGESTTAYYCLGCNQLNSVSTTWIAKERCTSKRWPPDVPVVYQGPIQLTSAGAVVSTNEG